ncbi:NmrA family NAD(P)-binding protein, partial [Persicitalea sp.]|uniref:NmrA family NAD(P)-binding protein n=1 Tax=Persicitalea sp. TaxID=3100273 RepID=UPI0035935C3D
MFLSVQGALGNRFIPHHKIEKLIMKSGMAYTFLRPAYFMQNFTTTLYHDLTTRRLIYLPADNAKFTLIDVRDIGEVAAQALVNPTRYVNQGYDLTSEKPLDFQQMAEKLSQILGQRI